MEIKHTFLSVLSLVGDKIKSAPRLVLWLIPPTSAEVKAELLIFPV